MLRPIVMSFSKAAAEWRRSANISPVLESAGAGAGAGDGAGSGVGGTVHSYSCSWPVARAFAHLWTLGKWFKLTGVAYTCRRRIHDHVARNTGGSLVFFWLLRVADSVVDGIHSEMAGFQLGGRTLELCLHDM